MTSDLLLRILMVYSVNYDLNNPGQNYEKVKAAVEALGPSIRVLKSTFLVSCPLSASVVWDKISWAFDTNDRAFISQVTSNHAGWLGTDLWNWLSPKVAA